MIIVIKGAPRFKVCPILHLRLVIHEPDLFNEARTSACEVCGFRPFEARRVELSSFSFLFFTPKTYATQFWLGIY